MPLGERFGLDVVSSGTKVARRAASSKPPLLSWFFCDGIGTGGVGLRQLGDVFAGILQGDELTAAWQRNWLVKPSLPAAMLMAPALRLKAFRQPRDELGPQHRSRRVRSEAHGEGQLHVVMSPW